MRVCLGGGVEQDVPARLDFRRFDARLDGVDDHVGGDRAADRDADAHVTAEAQRQRPWPAAATISVVLSAVRMTSPPAITWLVSTRALTVVATVFTDAAPARVTATPTSPPATTPTVATSEPENTPASASASKRTSPAALTSEPTMSAPQQCWSPRWRPGRPCRHGGTVAGTGCHARTARARADGRVVLCGQRDDPPVVTPDDRIDASTSLTITLIEPGRPGDRRAL
jgi:hypothetical protein